ncbi:MAG TPA: DUF5801 repeats-in-toxin domain-containing protein, partial [Devosia sp.]|nr:DUF5801 repeats-in-toxin domain-containing protein [Devosia sp.]
MAMEFDAAVVPASSGAQPNDRTATLVAETTTTQSSTPQTVTVALEAGDIVHLPAGTDISHMVQVGNDLEFIQPDGTVIVIPNGAVADLTVFVGNVEIPADTVAALYQTNNIHPAEGPTGGQGGGHEFNDPGPHGIGNAFGLTPLLGPNSLSFESNDVNTLEDTDFLPVWGTNPVILLDVSEEGLGSGNPDTNPDPGVVDTTNLTVRTGSLGVTDQDNDFLTFKLSGPSSPLTSDGHLISWSEISTAGTEILLGTDSVTHQAVLELTVTNARPSDGGGNYVLQLFQAIDHPVHGQEDNLAISLGVTVTDSKSAPVPATIVLTVEDDSPVVASSEAGQNLIVNGQFNDGTFIDLSGWAGQAATGSIPGWTIDGPQLERNPPDWYVSSDPAAGGKVVDLDASPGDVKITQTVTGLTDGEHYVLTFDASKPLGFDAKMNVIWNGNIVGVIDPTATSFSHYSFDLEANGSTGTLSFSEVGAPDNGGTFLANVELRDAGSFVDEDGLLNGIPGGPGDVPGASTVATEALNIKWGADNFDTSDVNGIQDGANSVGGLTGRALYFTDDTVTASFGSTAVTLQSAGETVHYELLANGTELVGYTGTFDASNQSNWVFTATLSDDGTGSYSFTLLKPLDHPVTNTEDNLALSFNITARDSDGDTAATGFTVSVNDDSPTVTASIANLADGLDFGSFTPNGNAWGQGSGTATGTNGGWTIAGSGTGNDGSGTIQLERVGDGYDAMHSSTHGYMVDLDASPHDVEISQKITGLSAGEQTVLHFEAGVPVGGTGTLEVWFGGQLIQTINPTHAMTGYSITLTGGSGDGKDILEFREVGAPDNVGTYLANVSVGGIIIDETPGIQGDSSEVAALSIFNSVVNPGSEMPAQYAQGSSPAVAVDAKYGADGPAASNALVYALSVTNGADSGLQTTDGHEIYLYNENGLVVGRYESDGSAGITTGDKAAFAFQLD